MKKQGPSVILSPAKVNLYLRIGPRRPDGFHGLVSWFCVLSLTDELVFALSDSGHVRLTCDHPAVPCDHRNLVLKAAEALRPFANRFTGFNIHLTKRIPMGGGLGGGSSNGAKALAFLADAWDCRLSPVELAAIAARLGSDVPFFLGTGSAVCRGRGEILTSVAPPMPRWITLLLPAIEMPTPAVYRKFDELGLGTDLDAVDKALPNGAVSASALLPNLINDLETPAFAISEPLRDLRSAAEQAIGQTVRMSGSGSTLFTLADTRESADRAAEVVRRQLGVKSVVASLCPDR